MGLIWTFRTYVSPRGEDEVRTWFDQQSGRVRAKFRSRLRVLGQQERSAWDRPYFALLSGTGAGLGEIRFNADGTEHRPLGFFMPGNVFTIVICALERNGRFVPHGAVETGLMRRAAILNNAERSHAIWLTLE